MPLDTYARNLAAQLTGRETWPAKSGPEAYAGRQPVQLLCDALFRGPDLFQRQLVGIENRPFKKRVGLDPERRFFSPTEITSSAGLNEVLKAFSLARQADPEAQPTPEQRQALDARGACQRLVTLASGQALPIVPTTAGGTFLPVGTTTAAPGTENVRAALVALGKAYAAGESLEGPVDEFRRAVDAAGTLDASAQKGVKLEVFYNHHQPWKLTAYFYGLSVVLFGISRLVLRRTLLAIALVAAFFGVVEHCLGIGLRTVILGRVPVSNTYESLLWMGLVAVAVGLVGQIVNRKTWYLFGGLSAALLSVLFSNLVPLESQTGALPAVLRSNYWLIIHVMTIVASYGALAVASILGHAYLIKVVLLGRVKPPPPGLGVPSHPLIVQTYRTIQLGLLLLTAGTILGGVWAAESWGRFWGWDPKETWALISIVVYFAVLHARYVRWLQDFGLAASAVLGFAAIVWTFYGVNYLMSSGLHSYGFGSGGSAPVAVWAIVEIAFVVVCKFKHRGMSESPSAAPEAVVTPEAAPNPKHAG